MKLLDIIPNSFDTLVANVSSNIRNGSIKSITTN